VSSSFPLEFTDSTEGIAALVQQYWHAFALCAWEGFLTHDRGIVELNLDGITEINADTLEGRINYGKLDPNMAEASQDPFKTVLEWTDVYDPNKEIILLVHGRNSSVDDDVRFYRFDSEARMAPPEVFEQYMERT
jgi:hypothetical protein